MLWGGGTGEVCCPHVLLVAFQKNLAGQCGKASAAVAEHLVQQDSSSGQGQAGKVLPWGGASSRLGDKIVGDFLLCHTMELPYKVQSGHWSFY